MKEEKDFIISNIKSDVNSTTSSNLIQIELANML